MASAHNTTNGEVQQQEKKLENMDLNSKVVEPPMNFYLSSLEEQVRCDLKDSEAKITPTPNEGRVLLEIDEDLLQHFLDCLQEKNEGELQRELEKTNTKLQKAQSELEQQASIIKEQDVKLEQMKEALRNEVEAKKMELRPERQMIAAAKTNVEFELKSYLDLLQTERLRSQQKTTTQELMDPHRASCLVQLGERRDIIEKLEAALEKAGQDQKTGALQWEDEKSSMIAEQEEVWNKYHAQLKIIASLRRQEKEAMKKLKRVQASHQAQLDEQRSGTKKIAAALEETRDLLQTERLRSQEKTTTQELMDPHRASCLVQLGEQRDIIEKLEAALEKAEQDQKTGALQWEDEKSSMIAEQEKITASLRTQEEEAMKKLERVQASHQVQLEDQTAETNRIAADLKNTADLLDLERLCCQELSSLTTTMEASQSNYLAKLEMQDNDNKNLMASLKKTFEDQLESERVLWQQEKDSFRVQLGHHQEENKNLLAAVTQAEQLLKRRTIEWQQEKTSLLQATENLQQTLHKQQQERQTTESSLKSQLEDLQSQITNKQKKKKKWYKLF